MSDTTDIVEQLRRRAHNGIQPMNELARLDMLAAAAEITRLRAALAQAGAVREPVAWMRQWFFDGEAPKKERNENGRLAWPAKFKFLQVTAGKVLPDDVPLYAHPSPAHREPLSEALIDGIAFGRGTEAGDTYAAIHEFARAIERAHGIGATSGTKGAA